MARPNTASLSTETIIRTAIELIGERGLEGFSMPKLAAELDVRTPSLYHYFANRDALLEAVARDVATPDAPPAVPADGDWTDYLISQAVALRRAIVAHPHCGPLLIRFMPRDNMFGEYEQLCRFLAASGVPPALHVHIVDGLTAMTMGAAILVENAADYADSGAGPTPDSDSHPELRKALDSIEGTTPDDLFESYLRTYLDGVLRRA